MLYKNVEIHNINELFEQENGSVSWCRVPKYVFDSMETDLGKKKACCSTGVELRFVMKSNEVTIRMRTVEREGIFHVYRGSIQGGWVDHEINKNVSTEFTDFVIQKSENLPTLNKITNEYSYPFSPEVVRVIFDRGTYELLDILGDVVPPSKEQLTQKTLLSYGSSISDGSNSIDASHSWVSLLSHHLKEE